MWEPENRVAWKKRCPNGLNTMSLWDSRFKNNCHNELRRWQHLMAGAQERLVIYLLLLPLLAAPTWLWCRCGRHNSPPASSVMDRVFCRCDGSLVSVDTVHPSLLRSSSLSSPGWYHLQSLSSYVVLVSPLYVAKPPQSRFPAPLCDTLYLQSLLDVFVSHVVS